MLARVRAERDLIGRGLLYAEIVEAYDGSSYLQRLSGGESATGRCNPWTDATQAMDGLSLLWRRFIIATGRGEGQYIDAAMIESSANFLGEVGHGNSTMNRTLGERMGNRDKVMAAARLLPLQGKRRVVAIALDGQAEWQAVRQSIGSPRLDTKRGIQGRGRPQAKSV